MLDWTMSPALATEHDHDNPIDIALAWVEDFSAALLRKDAGALADLFVPEGSWRDLVGFDWDIDTSVGRTEIAAAFSRKLASVTPLSFELSKTRKPPQVVRRTGVQVVEAFLTFQTSSGTGEGVVRLVSTEGGPAGAWVLMTALAEINGHPEWSKPDDDEDVAASRDFGGENWADKRQRAVRYDDRDPDVLIIGAGQAGLSAAARLKALNLDALVIDRHQELGDNWRKRYHSLALHNEVYGNDLPYMPFPASFPKFVPKDKLADWFKSYAASLDLNVWMKTALTGGGYDETTRRWSVDVETDGKKRTLAPKHLVFATGVSAVPIPARLPGLEDFKGTVVHSAHYGSGHLWAGKNAYVLGTGNSGHDVAQDLHACGAKVTMIQRSPTTVLSLKEAQKLYTLYRECDSVEEADLLSLAVPYPVLVKNYQNLTAEIRQADASLLEALTKRGFRLDFGPDGTGFQMKYLTRGGGYYFNVGCSDLIARGEIEIMQFSEIDRFAPEGILMKDGTTRSVDVLVTATGFKNQQDVVRDLIGDQIADRIGPVWGFGEERELRNMWRHTPQQGLWFNAGSMAQCRIYSKYLALQIKGRELGLC
jgi:cation diffusion facilitator CzcD-associated flavoprotein CzcO